MATITIGTTVTEVYGDLAAANAYFIAAIQADPWTAASSSTKNKALVTATRVFERTGWQGQPTEPIDKSVIPAPSGFQELQWPRTGLVDINGVAVPTTSIPQELVDGNFEYALALINDAALQQTAQQGTNLKVDKLTERVEGAITVATEQQFFRATIGKLGEFPNITQELVGLWLDSTTSGDGVFASGTDVAIQSGQDFCLTDGGFAS